MPNRVPSGYTACREMERRAPAHTNQRINMIMIIISSNNAHSPEQLSMRRYEGFEFARQRGGERVYRLRVEVKQLRVGKHQSDILDTLHRGPGQRVRCINRRTPRPLAAISIRRKGGWDDEKCFPQPTDDMLAPSPCIQAKRDIETHGRS